MAVWHVPDLYDYCDAHMPHHDRGEAVPRTKARFDAEVTRLRAESERLSAALNSDRTGLAAGLVAVIDRCKAGWWITESRGSYEWDDERYRDETRIALDAVVQIATLALRESGALVTRTFDGPLDAALKPGGAMSDDAKTEAIRRRWTWSPRPLEGESRSTDDVTEAHVLASQGAVVGIPGGGTLVIPIWDPREENGYAHVHHLLGEIATLRASLATAHESFVVRYRDRAGFLREDGDRVALVSGTDPGPTSYASREHAEAARLRVLDVLDAHDDPVLSSLLVVVPHPAPTPRGEPAGKAAAGKPDDPAMRARGAEP